MTAPQKLYGVTLKPHAKVPRKLIEIQRLKRVRTF